MRSRFRDVTGILLLDKPLGLSSNQALQKARHLYRARKAGHTGSLDPLATGLLPICFGEATKIAGYLLGERKAYTARCLLGVVTDTDDAEGQVISRRPVPELPRETIVSALAGLRGRIVQRPPVYSALKQAGEPLYRRARRGEVVDVPTREVHVHALDVLAVEADVVTLRVECGSGTYVRSLVRDLGEKLGCGAHLTALRRDWVMPFAEPSMTTLEQLQRVAADADGAGLERLLLPLEQGLIGLPAVHCDGAQAQALRQGKRWSQTALSDVALAGAFDERGRLVALVQVGADGEVRSLRGFAGEQGDAIGS